MMGIQNLPWLYTSPIQQESGHLAGRADQEEKPKLTPTTSVQVSH